MVLFIYIIQKGPFTMQYNKFESFFYENNIFYLEDNLTNDGKLPISFNRDALFCPECKSARLKFTSATSQKNAFYLHGLEIRILQIAIMGLNLHQKKKPVSII